MMEALVKTLIEKQYTIASIESLTAGLFASKLAEVPHASAVLKGGLITYQTQVKTAVLHVDEQLVAQYGVISKEVADAMAIKGQALFHSDIVVSFSGNAGPDVMDDKPVGLVNMAILWQSQLYSYAHIFSGNRNQIREAACSYMREQLMKLLG